MSESLPPCPSFLIIGAQKGATRWFRLNLGRHPEIFTAEEELSFFNTKQYQRGLEHYRRLFEGWNGEPVVGEATPGYMIWRHEPEVVSERIHRDLPDVKLFAVLRDPVDRLYSAFIHHIKRGRIDPEEDILERVRRVSPEDDQLQLVAGGWYARSLEPYMRRFGQRLTVVLNEDARSDPRSVYVSALAELGVDDSFVPPELDQVVFSRTPPEHTRYWQEGRGRRPLSDEEQVALGEYFVADIDRLEQMLDRDLSAWKH
ncbi:MAG TPA: sulfotransferase domain-containing protein, partial [Solirubrobacterales bacterium]